MPANCFYHPDRTAAHTCAQCGLPICEEDTDRVGDRAVCVRCVQAVRAKVEAQMASGPTPQTGYQAPQTGYQSQSQGYQSPSPGFQTQTQGGPLPVAGAQSFGGNAYAMPAVAPTPAQWAVGIVLGLVIAVAGAVAVAKFEAGASLSLSLLYVLVGYAVAWGVLKGVGRGGTPAAVAAVALYLVGVAAGMAADRAALGFTPHYDIIHWAFVAFGVYGCFRYVMRRA